MMRCGTEDAGRPSGSGRACSSTSERVVPQHILEAIVVARTDEQWGSGCAGPGLGISARFVDDGIRRSGERLARNAIKKLGRGLTWKRAREHDSSLTDVGSVSVGQSGGFQLPSPPAGRLQRSHPKPRSAIPDEKLRAHRNDGRPEAHVRLPPRLQRLVNPIGRPRRLSPAQPLLVG